MKGRQLMDQLDQILNLEEPAVLLHGDLWSGNAAADEQGEPVIYDPAAYYGQREAEFGMMRLFGGFGSRTESAYQEVWPFEPGYEKRFDLYRFYHELNHLNIFGQSYYRQCMDSLRSLC
jgi:fructosamine-3-kinase